MLTRPYATWLPQASFVKLDLSQLKPELVEPMVQFARKHTSAQLIAEKVETVEQYELASQHGIKLFQGYWFAKPVLVTGQTLRPAQANIIQLINLVRRRAETAEIEEVLKRDPTLSFNLLRFINSAGFGLSCEVTSFRHAVMILGLQKLFRWAALLLTTSKVSGASSAVGTTAVVRGRLMELLTAELLPPEECDNAFVVGVFSLLDSMLGLPMEQALASISLPESVTNALLHHTGLFAPFLELTIACETANDEAFARAANQLHLTNRQVNWAHLQALTWAETMTN
jgi:EAL and modified HD-GYP domain-containing signal transduction protein